MYYKTKYISPYGNITIVCDNKNLIGLWFEGQKNYGDIINENMIKKEDIPILLETKKWLDEYFEGKKPKISRLPLAPLGGTFRQEVWKILVEIPYGKTLTYGEIAKKVAKRLSKENMSAQAVGNAVGHNPISIIIPCHRVIGKNGDLIGYAAGIDIKEKLLAHENSTLDI